MNYYRTIHGVKYDGRLIDLADELVRGAGDGRISKQDAERILATVTDGNVYTPVERETIQYLHVNYHWTEAARDWFSNAIKKWEDDFKKPLAMTPAQLSEQHFPDDDVLHTEEERLSRHNDLLAATTETYQDHDDIALIVRLANGKRVEVSSNFIELGGKFVELRGGFDIPVRAIEKVEI